MSKLTFTSGGGDYTVITVDEQAVETHDGTQGHIYNIDGAFTLGDLATLIRLLQKREAADISAMDWAHLSDGDDCSLIEGDIFEDEDI